MENFQNFISGEARPPASGNWLEVFEPATGKVYAQVADSGAADVDAAVAAAHRAFPAWSGLSGEERGRWLARLADAIEGRLEEFARVETLDTGKPIRLARTVDIPRAARNFRFFAAAAQTFASEAHPTRPGLVNFTLRQPLGVVAAISPWNLPLYLLTWKIAPALAAGNTVVAKPSEFTPATAALLGDTCQRIGFLPGVLNILQGAGPGAGEPLVVHPDVAAVTFTGGTATGRRIAERTAGSFRKLSLELGGKNPSVVFADADLERAAETVVRAAFTNQGQICLCGSRILVQASVLDQFRALLLGRMQTLTCGDPMDENTPQGALVSEAHLAKVEGFVSRAREDSATVLTGGERVRLEGRCAGGYFFAPTLLEGLPAEHEINQREVFGPVATLLPFDDADQALDLANGCAYGLAASIFTGDLDRALDLAERIEAGIVWVNCWMKRDLRTPFGGMKQSGLGREGGWEALRFFTEPKNVTLAYRIREP